MVLLQTILVLILVYYAVKLLLRWLAPKLFGYAMKKTQERFGQQFHTTQGTQEPDEKEGETSVFQRPSRRFKPTKKVGEYIDFEEID
ncbi:DUF4834 family protein [Flagellimonas allohymeniacidonis]|uniref:DUF4834 family protein n=1 Tax=Flagellimonas allohymeniacidonis TaxID=2517819 RepID=A0A4Q8QFM6_9FLAO|nr:DUF4834 family protein [Allomuricauda hymeniacidonis]TAI48674.1 DUF4834 family protein [Allomuricauda hymeniacidonis]